MWKNILFYSFFCAHVCAAEIDLNFYEKSIYSPHGEDGVLAKIFQMIGPTLQYCVECGAHDGEDQSSTYFLRAQGWKAVLLDRKFEAANYNLHKEFITAENINQLFEKYKVPTDFTFLAINTKYNGYYFWKNLSSEYRPLVVMIKYNPFHLPEEDWVVKYKPFFCGDESDYFGTSILALYHLGKSKGYSLIYAEKSRTNLFFIRDDILDEKRISFSNMNHIEKLYRW